VKSSKVKVFLKDTTCWWAISFRVWPIYFGKESGEAPGIHVDVGGIEQYVPSQEFNCSPSGV